MGDGKSSGSGEEVLRRLNDMVEDDLSQLQSLSKSPFSNPLQGRAIPVSAKRSLCLGSGPSSDAWVLNAYSIHDFFSFDQNCVTSLWAVVANPTSQVALGVSFAPKSEAREPVFGVDLQSSRVEEPRAHSSPLELALLLLVTIIVDC